MQAIPIIGLVSNLIGFVSDMGAASDQEDAARANAAAEAAEAEESLRREKLANEEAESMNKARAAASGVDPTKGSVKQFLDEQAKQNELREKWIVKSSTSRQKAILTDGKLTASGSRGKAFGKLGGIAKSGYDVYSAFKT